MRFGLFLFAEGDQPRLGPETGQGFFEFLDFNVEAEALGFHSSFSVEHHFSGWDQVSRRLMLQPRWPHAHEDAFVSVPQLSCRHAQPGAAR